MGEREQPRRRARGLRDLVVILLVVAVLIWVTNLFEGGSAWLHRRLGGAEDDLLVGLLLLATGLAVFSIRRWSLERRESVARSEAETRYRRLVEQMPAVLYTWDPRKRAGTLPTPYVSPQVETILGFTADEWRADPELWIRQIHPEDRDRVLAASARADRTGEPFAVEYRHRKPDGTEVWIRDEAVVVERDGRGRPTLAQGFMYDITERKLAEESARETEARLRALVEQVPAVTYTWDPAATPGSIMPPYVSPQIEHLLGYTAEEWRADPNIWHERIHDDDRDRVLQGWDVAIRTRAAFRTEYRMRTRDERLVWIRDEAVPVSGDRANPRLYQGVMYDITERKHAEEQLLEAQERLRTLVEQLPVVVYQDAIDDKSTALYVSPQYERLFGYPPEARVNDPDFWIYHLHPEDRERVLAESERTNRTGEPFVIDYRFIARDGRVVWVRDEAILRYDADGNPSFWQGVLLDITERKLAEQALQESERREREAAERLRALDEMKNAFLAAVSHELRSPLTSILGLSLTLEQTQLSVDDQLDLLRRLATNARKLDRLLKDLLDIDRLSRGIVTPAYRPTDIGALVRRTVESLDLLGERPILVEAEPVSVEADPAKLERIVENLVINAVRHTRPQSRIWVRAWAEPDGAVIAVEDEGPGVPAELQREIFEPFRQGPTASPHSPGTGIGLSLVAMFAELHGGRAWVQERAGGGASFRVALPYRAAPSHEQPAAVRIAEAG